MTRRDCPHLFCFGLGYSAAALVQALPVSDWQVAGTARTAETAKRLREIGIEGLVFDGQQRSQPVAAELAQATHLLSSAPPGEAGDPVLRLYRDDIAANRGLRWIGYLSTTGVYGDTDGHTVDETAPLNPSSKRSRRRVAAEAEWLALHSQYGLPVHIFRLAGIYGPGRSAFDQIRSGTAKRIDKPGHAFSRIHVDDIGAVLKASIAKPQPGAIYNVCDDEPAPPCEVVEYACSLLEMEPPPLQDFETAKSGMSPMGLSFWNDNRRVDNGKLHRELGVKLFHPDYRSGLQAIFETEG